MFGCIVTSWSCLSAVVEWFIYEQYFDFCYLYAMDFIANVHFDMNIR